MNPSPQFGENLTTSKVPSSTSTVSSTVTQADNSNIMYTDFMRNQQRSANVSTPSPNAPQVKRLIRRITPIDTKKLQQSGLDRKIAEVLSKQKMQNSKSSNSTVSSSTIKTSSSTPISVIKTIKQPSSSSCSSYTVIQSTASHTAPVTATKHLPVKNITPPTITITGPDTLTEKDKQLMTGYSPEQRLKHVKGLLNKKLLKKVDNAKNPGMFVHLKPPSHHILTNPNKPKLLPTAKKSTTAAPHTPSFNTGFIHLIPPPSTPSRFEYFNEPIETTPTTKLLCKPKTPQKSPQDIARKLVFPTENKPPQALQFIRNNPIKFFNEDDGTTHSTKLSAAENDIPKASIKSVNIINTYGGEKQLYHGRQKQDFPEVSPLKIPFPTVNVPQETPLPTIDTFKKPYPMPASNYYHIHNEIQPHNNPPMEYVTANYETLPQTSSTHNTNPQLLPVVKDFHMASSSRGYSSSSPSPNLIVLENKVLSQDEMIDLTALRLSTAKTNTPQRFARPHKPIPEVIIKQEKPDDFPATSRSLEYSKTLANKDNKKPVINIDNQQEVATNIKNSSTDMVLLPARQNTKIIVNAQKLKLSQEKIAELAKKIAQRTSNQRSASDSAKQMELKSNIAVLSKKIVQKTTNQTTDNEDNATETILNPQTLVRSYTDPDIRIHNTKEDFKRNSLTKVANAELYQSTSNTVCTSEIKHVVNDQNTNQSFSIRFIAKNEPQQSLIQSEMKPCKLPNYNFEQIKNEQVDQIISDKSSLSAYRNPNTTIVNPQIISVDQEKLNAAVKEEPKTQFKSPPKASTYNLNENLNRSPVIKHLPSHGIQKVTIKSEQSSSFYLNSSLIGTRQPVVEIIDEPDENEDIFSAVDFLAAFSDTNPITEDTTLELSPEELNLNASCAMNLSPLRIGSTYKPRKRTISTTQKQFTVPETFANYTSVEIGNIVTIRDNNLVDIDAKDVSFTMEQDESLNEIVIQSSEGQEAIVTKTDGNVYPMVTTPDSNLKPIKIVNALEQTKDFEMPYKNFLKIINNKSGVKVKPTENLQKIIDKDQMNFLQVKPTENVIENFETPGESSTEPSLQTVIDNPQDLNISKENFTTETNKINTLTDSFRQENLLTKTPEKHVTTILNLSLYNEANQESNVETQESLSKNLTKINNKKTLDMESDKINNFKTIETANNSIITNQDKEINKNNLISKSPVKYLLKSPVKSPEKSFNLKSILKSTITSEHQQSLESSEIIVNTSQVTVATTSKATASMESEELHSSQDSEQYKTNESNTNVPPKRISRFKKGKINLVQRNKPPGAVARKPPVEEFEKNMAGAEKTNEEDHAKSATFLNETDIVDATSVPITELDEQVVSISEEDNSNTVINKVLIKVAQTPEEYYCPKDLKANKVYSKTKNSINSDDIAQTEITISKSGDSNSDSSNLLISDVIANKEREIAFENEKTILNLDSNKDIEEIYSENDHKKDNDITGIPLKHVPQLLKPPKLAKRKSETKKSEDLSADAKHILQNLRQVKVSLVDIVKHFPKQVETNPPIIPFKTDCIANPQKVQGPKGIKTLLNIKKSMEIKQKEDMEKYKEKQKEQEKNLTKDFDSKATSTISKNNSETVKFRSETSSEEPNTTLKETKARRCRPTKLNAKIQNKEVMETKNENENQEKIKIIEKAFDSTETNTTIVKNKSKEDQFGSELSSEEPNTFVKETRGRRSRCSILNVDHFGSELSSEERSTTTKDTKTRRSISLKLNSAKEVEYKKDIEKEKQQEKAVNLRKVPDFKENSTKLVNLTKEDDIGSGFSSEEPTTSINEIKPRRGRPPKFNLEKYDKNCLKSTNKDRINETLVSTHSTSDTSRYSLNCSKTDPETPALTKHTNTKSRHSLRHQVSSDSIEFSPVNEESKDFKSKSSKISHKDRNEKMEQINKQDKQQKSKLTPTALRKRTRFSSQPSELENINRTEDIKQDSKTTLTILTKRTRFSSLPSATQDTQDTNQFHATNVLPKKTSVISKMTTPSSKFTDPEDSCQDSSYDTKLPNKKQRKKLRKTLEDIKKSTQKPHLDTDSDNDEDRDFDSVNGLDDGNEFLGFEENSAGSSKMQKQLNHSDEENDTKMTSTSSATKGGTLKNWLTTGKAISPTLTKDQPVKRLRHDDIVTRAVPLKKRWDLKSKQHEETDITDDTSPADDEEEKVILPIQKGKRNIKNVIYSDKNLLDSKKIKLNEASATKNTFLQPQPVDNTLKASDLDSDCQESPNFKAHKALVTLEVEENSEKVVENDNSIGIPETTDNFNETFDTIKVASSIATCEDFCSKNSQKDELHIEKKKLNDTETLKKDTDFETHNSSQQSSSQTTKLSKSMSDETKNKDTPIHGDLTTQEVSPKKPDAFNEINNERQKEDTQVQNTTSQSDFDAKSHSTQYSSEPSSSPTKKLTESILILAETQNINTSIQSDFTTQGDSHKKTDSYNLEDTHVKNSPVQNIIEIESFCRQDSSLKHSNSQTRELDESSADTRNNVKSMQSNSEFELKQNSSKTAESDKTYPDNEFKNDKSKDLSKLQKMEYQNISASKDNTKDTKKLHESTSKPKKAKAPKNKEISDKTEESKSKKSQTRKDKKKTSEKQHNNLESQVSPIKPASQETVENDNDTISSSFDTPSLVSTSQTKSIKMEATDESTSKLKKAKTPRNKEKTSENTEDLQKFNESKSKKSKTPKDKKKTNEKPQNKLEIQEFPIKESSLETIESKDETNSVNTPLASTSSYKIEATDVECPSALSSEKIVRIGKLETVDNSDDEPIQHTPKIPKKRGRKRKLKIEDFSDDDANMPLSETSKSSNIPDNLASISTPHLSIIKNDASTDILTPPSTKRRGRKINTDTASAPSNFNSRLLLITKREQLDSDEKLTESNPGPGPIQCGLCLQRTTPAKWTLHIGEHYGIGWKLGEEQINIENRAIVLKMIISYFNSTEIKGLSCRICKKLYRSALGLLLHVETCGAPAIRVMCEYCKRDYSKLSIPIHHRTCPERIKLENPLYEGVKEETEEQPQEVFGNTGRLKRHSTIKAEDKLKAIGAELEKIILPTKKPLLEIIPEDHIKFVPPFDVNGEIYKKWSDDINNFGNGFCPNTVCKFNSPDVKELEKHINECERLKWGYFCNLCRNRRFDTEKEAISHLNKFHKHNDEDEDDSDCNLKTEDEQSSEDDNELSEGIYEDEFENEEVEESDEDADYYKKRGGGIKRSTVSKKTLLNLKNVAAFRKRVYEGRAVNINKEVYDRWNNFCSLNYSSEPLFKNLTSQYTIINNQDFAKYLPSQVSSMKFNLETQSTLTKTIGIPDPNVKWMELKRFEAMDSKSETFFFLGAPVKFCTWIPLPENVNEQYLLVCYRKEMFKFIKFIQPKQHHTVLLLFKVTETNKLPKLELHYGLLINDGPVHCATFLPSGGYNVATNRLGMVAVGTVNATIKIYALPIEIDLKECDKIENVAIIDIKPSFQLNIDVMDQGQTEHTVLKPQCLQIIWSEFLGHTNIFASFSNGFVGIWDVTDDPQENLNRFVVENIVSYTVLNYFYIGEKCGKCFAIHYDTEGPRWLAISSMYRRFLIYDIKNLMLPIIIREDCNRNVVRSLDWSPLYGPVLVGYCDSIPNNGRCVSALSPTNILFANQKFDNFASGVSQIHYTPVTNLCVCSVDNGDILFTDPRELHYDSVLGKKFGEPRRLLSSMDVKQLDNNPIWIPPTTKQTETSNEYKVPENWTLPEQNYKDKYGLIFKSLIKIQESNKSQYLNAGRRTPLNITPFTRVNTLRCNLNTNAKRLVVAGYENGFIRIIYFNKVAKFGNW